MKQPIRILNSLDDIEIQFFDEDPDGAEDRAGDGYYFRVAGEEGWSGSWHSEDEAMDEAVESMLYTERRNIVEEAAVDGFQCVRNDDDGIALKKKIDGRHFRILVDFENYRVHAKERFLSGEEESILDTEVEDLLPEKMEGEEETGHLQTVVRNAIEAVEARLAPALAM